MGQKNYERHSSGSEEMEPLPVAQDTEAKEKLDADVDAILDEIDDVLEENAEEFVRNYIQKGGQ